MIEVADDLDLFKTIFFKTNSTIWIHVVYHH